MKSIMKWLLRLVGLIVILVLIAGVAVYFIVDKDMVAEQMEKVLHRHVTIEDIDVGILSVISGIEVKAVRISNHKTEKELQALKGKPVKDSDLFAGLKSFTFKTELLPLFKKRFVLKELLLTGPVINIVKSKQGYFNFNDLLVSKPLTAEEKAELEKQRREEAVKGQQAMKADDLPIAINIGKIGIENGTINYNDLQLNQRVQIYRMKALFEDISIDPADLKNSNQALIDLSMGIKTIGKTRGGSVESFDMGISAKGKAIPFDQKTRLLNPEISLKVGSSYGTVTGLQIYDKLVSVEQLRKYTGKFAFLQKNLKWKSAFVNLWYKGGTARLTNGKISTDDYEITFDGTHNTYSKAVALNMDMTVDKKHNAPVKSALEKNAKKVVTGRTAQVVTPSRLADEAMKPLVNKNGNIYLKYAVGGVIASPSVKLVHPKLPSLKDLAKKAAGSAGTAVKSAAKEKASAATTTAKKEAASKSKKAASKLKKKLF